LKREGHLFSEICEYTLDQMLFFYADAVEARIDYMLDVRTAVWTDKDGIDKYIARIVEG
jgi:hypothetical protein